MGRYYWSKKNTVEDSTKLSIAKLKEFGLLGGCCGSTLTWTRKLSGYINSIGIMAHVELSSSILQSQTLSGSGSTLYRPP